VTAFRIERLAFGYADRLLFEGLDLDIPAGEYLAVVGPNGAGKSTLLRLLAGLIRPRSGRVLIDGRDIRTGSRAALARLVAVVPQDSHFAFDYTVEEVVMMGRNPWVGYFQAPGTEDRARVEEALAVMGLVPLRGARIGELSGGERRCAVIARALAQATPAVLLDEPGTHLDLAHLDRLAGVLSGIHAGGRTVVLVSHDINFAAASCSRLLVLSGGEVAAAGSPTDVLSPRLVHSVYGIEPVIMRHPRTGRPVCLLPGMPSQGRPSSTGVESVPSKPAA
jgi:iron complex transport system ATP-binding protein